MPAMADPFECELEARGDEAWVLPTGELDLASAPELEESLSLALASDARAIVVDLRGLDLLDSSGLRVLLQAHASETGDRISFVPGSEIVQAVLRISGVLEELRLRSPEG